MPATAYADTAAWAQGLDDGLAMVDGLAWSSRQHHPSRAVMLWGTRTGPGEFEVLGPPRPLGRGVGPRGLRRLAAAAGVTLVEG